MLVKQAVLEGIARGDIDLQFRRWRKPTVKSGGTLRTRIGMLDILEVERTAMRAITADQAHRAGYRTRKELLADLQARSDGSVYRIGVRLGGADPLIELRNVSSLTAEDVADIRHRLDRMDSSAPDGPWTESYLELLADHPHVRAEDLARSIGLTKPVFKANVRKLKALGLTISHSPGYELSPRGRAYLTATTD